ncbi:MAG: metallophosphoesterase [Candidatus Poribacteria bacterium]|nr:MAG: metallophosphoesterase [Candidatus Poribacteria bacterium]
MKILFIGDIVGRPGRRAVREGLPLLQERYGPFDLVLANAENAAGGNGLTAALAKELTGYGVDFMTTGNHVWDQKEFVEEIAQVENVLRPLNLPPGTPGRGWALVPARNGLSVGLLNAGGKIFMPYDNPFLIVEETVERLREQTPIIVVDFHAEATSEKLAMGWFLDGRATLVVGTHTHVQTADETILPNGTAYITDVGMTGPHDSVIGVDKEGVLRRFLTQMPAKLDVASGDVRLCAVAVQADPETGRALSIERLCLRLPDSSG